MMTRMVWTAQAVFLGLVVVVVLGPLAWLGLTALTPVGEFGRGFSLPHHLTAAHFLTIFAEVRLARFLLNSVVVGLATTALCLALGTPVAFALACLRVRGRTIILAATLVIAMFPPIAIVSPVYLLARALGWRDTWIGLVMVDTTFALPLTIWIMTHFFLRLPRELLQAARVDGCTAWQAMRHVALPLSAPGFTTAALLVFIATWNEFLFAYSLTATPRARTVPVAIALFPGLHEIPWGEIAAAALVVLVPVLVLVFLCERYIVAGLTAGAVKG